VSDTASLSVDRTRLRAGRLARLQAAMRARDVEACLLFNDPNIRYATGTSAMPIWSNTTFVRCALVGAEGRPILFDYPNAVHLFRDAAQSLDVRPMTAWEFYDDTDARAPRSPGRSPARLRSAASPRGDSRSTVSVRRAISRSRGRA